MFRSSFLTPQKLDQIKDYLEPYKFLDKSKNEGAACKFKFSNDNIGVPSEAKQFMNDLASAVIANPAEFMSLPKDDRLDVIDALVLYSNHLDQQTSSAINPQLSKEQQQVTVLHWLTAANKLCPAFNTEQLQEDNIKELSSMAQTFHYYGKALRYDSTVTTATRKPVLTNAQTIASFLTSCHAPEALDRHYFTARESTYITPLGYIEADEKHYDNALALMQQLLNVAPNLFHQIQAHAQWCNVLKEKFLHENDHSVLPAMLEHAESAFNLVNEMALAEGKPNMILYFNANVARMNAYALNDQAETAREIAQSILSNPAGSKPHHISAAEQVMDQTAESTLTMGR